MINFKPRERACMTCGAPFLAISSYHRYCKPEHRASRKRAVIYNQRWKFRKILSRAGYIKGLPYAQENVSK